MCNTTHMYTISINEHEIRVTLDTRIYTLKHRKFMLAHVLSFLSTLPPTSYTYTCTIKSDTRSINKFHKLTQKKKKNTH